MAISEADLKFLHPEEVSSVGTNGGLMSQIEIVSGQKNNLWENASSDDRLNGRDDKRKVFCSPQSDDDQELFDPKIWNHAPTPGDDYVMLYPATKTDTQAEIITTRAYGCGTLANDVAVGADTLVVTVENTAQLGFFKDGDKIRLSNQTSPELTGDYEDVDVVAAPSAVGLDITISISATTLAFLASNTVVSSLYAPGSSSTGTGTIVVTSASGTVDESGFAPVLNNIGTIDEELTFSFSDATNFTVSGSRSGALASGVTIADYTAINPDNGKNLIELPTGFFGGTFAALDTVVIPTIANNFAFWLNRIIPAGSDTLNGDLNISAFTGES